MRWQVDGPSVLLASISSTVSVRPCHSNKQIPIPFNQTNSRLFLALTHEEQKQGNNDGSHHSKYPVRSIGRRSGDMADYVTLRGDSGPGVNHSHFCVSRLLRIVHFDFHKEGDDVFCR